MPDFAPDRPLKLSVAAKVAFPDGTMTASGLRREALRGKLVVERIAGKDYTSLAAIDAMRERCRVNASRPDCGYSPSEATKKLSIASLTTDQNEALAAARARLQKRKRR